MASSPYSSRSTSSESHVTGIQYAAYGRNVFATFSAVSPPSEFGLRVT